MTGGGGKTKIYRPKKNYRPETEKNKIKIVPRIPKNTDIKEKSDESANFWLSFISQKVIRAGGTKIFLVFDVFSRVFNIQREGLHIVHNKIRDEGAKI